MKRRAAWSILMLVTVLMGFSLFSTEVSYIRFIESLRSIKLTVQNAELNASSVRFVLLFENSTKEKIVLEGIAYRLCLSEYEVSSGTFSGRRVLLCPKAKSLGSYYTAEQSGLIPPQGLSVPLKVDLDSTYQERFLAEQAAGPVSIHLIGEARLKLEKGKAEQVVKLPFREVIHE